MNVTWNVTGNFNVDSNISYLLESYTLWVSKRKVSGNFTDPSTVDQDTVSGVDLKVQYSPFIIVNSTNPWVSEGWIFNYTDPFVA